MATLLIDTNIVSYLFKGDSRAHVYQPLMANHDLFVSVITVAELAEWSQARGWHKKRLEQLQEYLQAQYDVIPIETSLCDTWAAVRLQAQLVGRPIAQNDAWIAATALQYNLPLVTHNAKDFAPIANLRLITGGD